MVKTKEQRHGDDATLTHQYNSSIQNKANVNQMDELHARVSAAKAMVEKIQIKKREWGGEEGVYCFLISTKFIL